ncbi:murein DD-endopeptidase MepM/ murein hydrolase activator NlpD [Hamadaea flava]|uniref:M23 family metallopeptidase n=1 Tax=Hamadaea flava TaxID=1742688 RepID=A0ABV8LJR7_9ACTN|nr:M23 family metallopeptidase [Hamadaea flava]MCP2323649.1 murein DD-endopeptidase MepM/ murein hydrolase activator NlpD [Hamadaea flava]
MFGIGKLLASLVAGVLTVVLLGAVTVLGGFGSAASGCAQPATTAGSGTSVTPAQLEYAGVIVRAGHEAGAGSYGATIAVAVALQESGLRNLANPAVPASLAIPHDGIGTDHDSLGLFQQRPSAGWGTPADLMNPAIATKLFYTKLLKLPNWRTMALTEAAQAVQRSAYPDAYAKHTTAAQTLVAVASAQLGIALDGCDPISAGGWTQPVHAPIVSGFRTSSRPTHNGVDLGAARNTQIHAAAAGTVIVSKCDVGNCDHDGSPSTPGCGWFVDILHADRIITRYCHMVQRPFAAVGDRVQAGQVIGLVGTSGHSSGPHLHFETHLGGDRSFAGGVDPVPFMAARGVPLGTSE